MGPSPRRGHVLGLLLAAAGNEFLRGNPVIYLAAYDALCIAVGASTPGRPRGPGAVRAALEHTARDLGPAGRDDETGWGLVDAGAALDYGSEPGMVVIVAPERR